MTTSSSGRRSTNSSDGTLSCRPTAGRCTPAREAADGRPRNESARATFCQRLRGEAGYGYDHLTKRTFYGFRLHPRTTREGVLRHYELAPARAREAAVLGEL